LTSFTKLNKTQQNVYTTAVKSAQLGVDMARYAKVSCSELVKLCAKSRDEWAWAEFIRRFQVVIASAVIRTARQWGDLPGEQIDDLVQETYLKLCENDYRRLATFRSRHTQAVYGYLKIVATNVVHDYFKSAHSVKRGAGITEVIIDLSLIDERTSSTRTFDEVTQRLQLHQIAKILKLVTAGKDQKKKRAIFWLRHHFGLTAREIASMPWIELTTEGVESVLMRLAILIRGHITALILTLM
jgi:RNA polymerase sigma-70 factor, ECF subfamily